MKSFLFILIVLFASLVKAQPKPANDFSIMANYHYGVLLPEYQLVNYIANDYIRGVDLSIYKKTIGKNIWEQLYNYPEYGISLFYTTLGNNKVFGNEIALSYYFRLFLISTKRFQLYNRTGIGLSYISKKFDLEDNYMNVAIGSYYNMHFNCRLGFRYTLAEKYTLNAGLSFDHASNANTSEPNLGINCLTSYAGIAYTFGNSNEIKSKIIPEHAAKNYFEVFANAGGKHTRALSSKYFPTVSTAIEYHRSFFRAVHFGTGIDLFYDGSIHEQYKKLDEEYKESYSFQSGIHISQSFVYNRIKIEIQEGIYVLLPEQIANNKIYTKAIIKYNITPKVSLRFLMKSHLHILDYPEIGIGYKL